MKKTRQSGFLQIVIIVIIAIVIISLLGINLRDIAENEKVRSNLTYAYNFASDIWENWLKEPALWVHENILKPFVIEPFLSFFEERGGESELPTPAPVGT